MKRKLILIVPTFLIGAILGGIGGSHFSDSRHREIKSATRILRDIQLATRSAPSDNEDLPLSEALEEIPGRTLIAYAKSKNGSTALVRELNTEALSYSKAFYIYTEREIPKELNQALANVEPISRDKFVALVGNIGTSAD